jgi:hypothetical protein
MTQQAIARILKAHLPAIIYTPSLSKIPCDTPQRGSDRYVGYQALWIKVIIRAAFDWVSYRDSPKLELRKEAEKAYKWLFLPSTLFNSFENVCDLSGLPPDRLRRWVQSLTKAHVAKIEHLERESSTFALQEATKGVLEQLYEDEDV